MPVADITHLTQHSFLPSWDKPPGLLNTALQEVIVLPSEMTFYVIFVDILILEATVQNAEGPVYHSHSRKINLHLILSFLILTFKAI